MTAEVSPLHFRLTDNGDGTWALAQNGPVSIRLAVPGTLTFDAAADAMAMDCTFDTALMACRTSATTVSGVRSRQTQTDRSEEHTSELQSRENLVCRLLL